MSANVKHIINYFGIWFASGMCMVGYHSDNYWQVAFGIVVGIIFGVLNRSCYEED